MVKNAFVKLESEDKAGVDSLSKFKFCFSEKTAAADEKIKGCSQTRK